MSSGYLGYPTGSNVHWVWNGSDWILLAYGGGGSSSGSGGNDPDFVIGDNRLRTTSSVSFGSGTNFAQDYGTDVFFYVSGTTGLDGSSAKRAVFGGDLVVSGGLSGSLQRLTNGVSYLTAGENVTISSQSNGQIIISSQATNTQTTINGFQQANYAFVTSSNEYTLTVGSTFVGVPNLTASITTAGDPVFITVNANYTAVSGSPQSVGIFSLARNGQNLGNSTWGTMVAGPLLNTYNNSAAFTFVDFPPSGTYTYSVIACNPTGSGKITAFGVGPAALMVFEMKGANVITASTMTSQSVPNGPVPGLSATILPTRGPVLAIASMNYSNNLAGNWAWFQTRRDSTDLGSTFGLSIAVGTTAGEMQNASNMVLDTPSLGTSHTYTVRATNGAGTGIVGKNGQLGTIILWELNDVNFKYGTTTTNVPLGSSYTDIVQSSPALTIIPRGRPIFIFGGFHINTTSTTGRSAWSFLRNGTDVVTSSKGMQLLDGEGNNDWDSSTTMFWLDTNITGATSYQLVGKNISGSNTTAQGPTLTTFLLYELDAGKELVIPPWVDGGSRIRTTSSVAIGSDELFTNQKASDVFFYVSGTIGTTGSSAKRSFFGGDTVHSGAIVMAGGIIYNNVVVTGSYSIQRNDFVVGVNQPNGSSSFIFTPTEAMQGRAYKILDLAGNAASGSIIISGSAGELIIGSSTYPITTNYGAVEIIRLNNGWSLIN